VFRIKHVGIEFSSIDKFLLFLYRENYIESGKQVDLEIVKAREYSI